MERNSLITLPGGPGNYVYSVGLMIFMVHMEMFNHIHNILEFSTGGANVWRGVDLMTKIQFQFAVKLNPKFIYTSILNNAYI